MRKLSPIALFVVSCALGIGLAAGSLATAAYTPPALDELDDDVGEEFEMAGLPMPASGSDLFIVEDGKAACIDRDQVVSMLLADQTELGGRTVKVTDDRMQAFADTWRDRTGLRRIAISGVVGHIFFDENVADWTVDVTEFDAAGCAMSRTFLPGALWSDLLRGSAQV
jgi:hypothetical protein